MAEKFLNIGIAGAGGFAHFAATAFLKIHGIRIVAIADINENASSAMAAELNAIPFTHYQAFLESSEVDLVYIATPPCFHYTQSKLALLRGKHVICEKPAALRTAEAVELSALARSKNLLYVVNLMQRYNPLYSAVNTIVKEKLLGSFLHGFFENYASDENLPPDHWFWDTSKSGGIFIEHGVHFFDMFAGWFGEEKVLRAFQLQRDVNGNKITDRVQATLLYKDAPVNFYHGFNQPKILDRQEMRLQFERGEITLYEWIPVRLKTHGLLSGDGMKKIMALLGNDSVVIEHEPQVKAINAGHFTESVFNRHVTIECGNASEKTNRYQQMLMAMITDQRTWIYDRNHIRLIDEYNAIDSLRTAVKATEMAQQI